jgi:predicted nucleic acid-binding protein
MHIIDTCILIDYLRTIPQAKHYLATPIQRAISIMTWIEILVGAKSEAETHFLKQFLQQFQIIQLDTIISEQAIILRQQHRMRLPDAIIWATAKVHTAKLVTRNIKDFSEHHADIYIPYTL